MVTFFPFDPSHVMARGAGAALVRQNGLQVVVAAVVGAHICRRSRRLTHLHTVKRPPMLNLMHQTYRLGMKRVRISPPWLRLASLPTTGQTFTAFK